MSILTHEPNPQWWERKAKAIGFSEKLMRPIINDSQNTAGEGNMSVAELFAEGEKANIDSRYLNILNETAEERLGRNRRTKELGLPCYAYVELTIGQFLENSNEILDKLGSDKFIPKIFLNASGDRVYRLGCLKREVNPFIEGELSKGNVSVNNRILITQFYDNWITGTLCVSFLGKVSCELTPGNHFGVAHGNSAMVVLYDWDLLSKENRFTKLDASLTDREYAVIKKSLLHLIEAIPKAPCGACQIPMPGVYEFSLTMTDDQPTDVLSPFVFDADFDLERVGLMTAHADICKLAVGMVEAGIIAKEEALLKIHTRQLELLLHKQFSKTALQGLQVAARGLPASPGAAVGQVVLTSEDAVKQAPHGPVLLVREVTNPADMGGMYAACGILTKRGGMTSHAVLTVRTMAKCCVAGCNELSIHEDEGYITLDGKRVNVGDWISIDGNSGKVFTEKIQTEEAELSAEFHTILGWADSVSALKVRANINTPEDAAQAVKFGADGVGLCRTEHMFSTGDRINILRKMILADSEEDRRNALSKLLPMQRQDFEKIYGRINGSHATIRLLDPPITEFVPHIHDEMGIQRLSAELEFHPEALREKIGNLSPGYHGCRLSVCYPEITEMQVQAIIEAAINVKKKGIAVYPQIMIPLVSDPAEFKYVKSIITKTADAIIKESGSDITYKCGSMLETPRAILLSEELEVDFFSFGSNDLTEATYHGLSRDDNRILKAYCAKKYLHLTQPKR